ncbi:MAG TPA: DUF1922 domain-containing protein [Methylomirabilota bacterium]|nr:DUF1922 domain-containing protein [Methylomirabilota bacterium]
MEIPEKKHYLILECNTCKRYLLAVSSNKTRTCPYCGKRVALENARLVSRLKSAEEARLALQKLKIQGQQNETAVKLARR